MNINKNNYKAWDIEIKDFFKHEKLEQKIKFFIKFGILSANIHNTQPWLFDILKDSVVIYPNWKYQLLQADMSSKNLFISLGCAVKNIECIAAYYKLSSSIEINGNTLETTNIKIRFSNKNFNKNLAILAPFITKRFSNKTMYENSKVNENSIKVLQTISLDSNLELILNNDTATINELAKLQEKAVINLKNNKAFIRELASWLRPNDTNLTDGMPGFVVGLKNIQARIAKLIMPNLPQAIEILAKNDRKLLSGSPLVGSIIGNENGVRAWIDIGRAYEELALKAFSENVHITPMHSIIEDRSTIRSLALLLNAKDKKPQFFFRLGYSKYKPYHTPRRKVEDVIINDITEINLAKTVSPNIEFKKIQIGKHLINYIKVGYGKPLLLIHGGNIGWGQWYTNIEDLSKHFTVYAIDLPGGGRSSRIDYKTLDFERDFLHVVEKFIQELDLKKPHIVGSSIGGWLTAKIAINNPKNVGKVIIVDAIGVTNYLRPMDKLMKNYKLAQFIASTMLKPVRENKNIEAFIRSVFYNSKLSLNKEFIEYFYETMRTSHNLLFISKTTNELLTTNTLMLKSNLNKLKNPTLVLWGEYDKLIPYEKAKKTVEEIPNVKVVLVKNASHIPSIENSVEFNKATLKFLLA